MIGDILDVNPNEEKTENTDIQHPYGRDGEVFDKWGIPNIFGHTFIRSATERWQQ